MKTLKANEREKGFFYQGFMIGLCLGILIGIVIFTMF